MEEYRPEEQMQEAEMTIDWQFNSTLSIVSQQKLF